MTKSLENVDKFNEENRNPPHESCPPLIPRGRIPTVGLVSRPHSATSLKAL